MTLKNHLPAFIRYASKGAGTLFANIALMAALVETDRLPPELAAIVSQATVLCIGYVLMNRFVFADAPSVNGTAHARRGVAYMGIILSGKAINYAIFLALLWAGVWYPVAWVLGAATVTVGLYAANRKLWHGSITT